MNNETTTDKPSDAASGQNEPVVICDYMSLEHRSTVVTCTNDSELHYLLRWAERLGKVAGKWMYLINIFPVYIGTSGDVLSWIDLRDRALYYKPFLEFINEINILPETKKVSSYG
jgi:hypothetical protein